MRYGVWDMLSMPPATTVLESPTSRDCPPSITALSPDPHTLLIVMQGTLDGSPAKMAAWRAGACPTPAVKTQPIITSSTFLGDILARFTASRMAKLASFGAEREASDLQKEPTGVRTALKM